jgi:hypothetical protein
LTAQPTPVRSGKWLRDADGRLRMVARTRADEDFILGTPDAFPAE